MTTEHRDSERPDTGPSNPVWRLHSAKQQIVECSVHQTMSKLYAVTVTIGSEILLDESYPDSAGAMRRAMQVRNRLIESGGWVASKRADLS